MTEHEQCGRDVAAAYQTGLKDARRQVRERREEVAKALYRQCRIEEAQLVQQPDPEVYAGWFPWEQQGTAQERWRRQADVVIEVLTRGVEEEIS